MIFLRREQFLMGGALAVFTLIAWVVTLLMSMPEGTEVTNASDVPDSGLSGSGWVGFVTFQLMWLSMMVAMMFPSTAPMILMFNRITQQRKSQGAAFVPTWIFVSGYLVIWAFFGILVYLIIVVSQPLVKQLIGQSSPLLLPAGQVVILLLAGLYQFSALKTVCLSHCQSSFSFIFHHWREGFRGAFWMGLHHGMYCVGCCWGLMFVLFAVGLMNLPAMGFLTLVIFIEKISRHGLLIGRMVGFGLIAFSIWIALRGIW